MPVRLDNKTLKAVHRWIKPYVWSHVISSAINGTAGRIRLMLFEISEPTLIDGIEIYNYVTVAGNATIGIYGTLTTEETAVNSVVLAESASTALAGASAFQFIPFTTPITLPIGRYYVAVEFSDTTYTYAKISEAPVFTGLAVTYDRGGGYGTLTNPCPATTQLTTLMPAILIRCVV